MKKSHFIIILFMFNLLNTKAQSSFNHDFNYLCNEIENVHPNIFEHLSIKEYCSLKQSFSNRIKNECVNTIDFYFLLQEFLSIFKDGHTGIMTSFFDENYLYYPMKFMFCNNKFIIIMSDNEEMLGENIISINNIDIDSIITLMGKYIGAENDIAKRMYIADILSIPIYYQYIRIINTQYDTIHLTLSNGQEYNIIPNHEKNIDYKIDTSLTKHPISGYKSINYYYSIHKDKNIAYLQLNEMRDKATHLDDFYDTYNFFQRLIRHKIFKEYTKYSFFSKKMDRMFSEMKKEGVENLIIDLRYNGGGNSILGDQLLYFLLTDEQIKTCKSYSMVSRISKQIYHRYRSVYKDYKKGEYGDMILGNLTSIINRDFINQDIKNPRSFFYIPDTINKFQGNIYFIQGCNTFSSASDLLTKIYDNKLFITIGEPTAQAPTSFGDRFIFTLPYSKINCSVSWKYFMRPDSSNVSNILHPNIYIPNDYQALRDGKDMAIEWILQQVNDH
jgi:hypothetical protein